MQVINWSKAGCDSVGPVSTELYHLIVAVISVSLPDQAQTGLVLSVHVFDISSSLAFKQLITAAFIILKHHGAIIAYLSMQNNCVCSMQSRTVLRHCRVQVAIVYWYFNYVQCTIISKLVTATMHYYQQASQ